MRIPKKIISMMVSLMLIFSMCSGAFQVTASARGNMSGNKTYFFTAEDVGRRLIWNYLENEMGLSHSGIVGILANMQAESNYRTDALGDGGTSYGLCQWHEGRCVRLMEFAEGQAVDTNNIVAQLGFFKHEMETKYPLLLEELRNLPDTEDAAYIAAYEMCVKFECPAGMYESAAYRGYLAQEGFERIERSCEYITGNLCDLYMLCMTDTQPFTYTPNWEAYVTQDPYGPVSSEILCVSQNRVSHIPVDVVVYNPNEPEPTVQQPSYPTEQIVVVPGTQEQAEKQETTPASEQYESTDHQPSDADIIDDAISEEVGSDETEIVPVEPSEHMDEQTDDHGGESEEPDPQNAGDAGAETTEELPDEIQSSDDKEQDDPEAIVSTETDDVISGETESEETESSAEPQEEASEESEQIIVRFVLNDDTTLEETQLSSWEQLIYPTIPDKEGVKSIGWALCEVTENVYTYKPEYQISDDEDSESDTVSDPEETVTEETEDPLKETDADVSTEPDTTEGCSEDTESEHTEIIEEPVEETSAEAEQIIVKFVQDQNDDEDKILEEIHLVSWDTLVYPPLPEKEGAEPIGWALYDVSGNVYIYKPEYLISDDETTADITVSDAEAPEMIPDEELLTEFTEEESQEAGAVITEEAAVDNTTEQTITDVQVEPEILQNVDTVPEIVNIEIQDTDTSGIEQSLNEPESYEEQAAIIIEEDPVQTDTPVLSSETSGTVTEDESQISEEQESLTIDAAVPAGNDQEPENTAESPDDSGSPEVQQEITTPAEPAAPAPVDPIPAPAISEPEIVEIAAPEETGITE